MIAGWNMLCEAYAREFLIYVYSRMVPTVPGWVHAAMRRSTLPQTNMEIPFALAPFSILVWLKISHHQELDRSLESFHLQPHPCPFGCGS